VFSLRYGLNGFKGLKARQFLRLFAPVHHPSKVKTSKNTCVVLKVNVSHCILVWLSVYSLKNYENNKNIKAVTTGEATWTPASGFRIKTEKLYNVTVLF
jgi:hypothetical protein